MTDRYDEMHDENGNARSHYRAFDQWLTVTTRVEDPQYFRGPYITTTDFTKLPDAKGWNPTPCSVR